MCVCGENLISSIAMKSRNLHRSNIQRRPPSSPKSGPLIYLRLLQGTEPDTIQLLSREFHDNNRYRGTENAVATTWLVSFEQIRKSDTAAADLLMFISLAGPSTLASS